MHSRIFVVRTRQEVESGNYESLYGEDGLYDTIYMADYVSKRSADNFVGDLDRLTDSYPCNILQKKFNVDGEVFASGVINSENIGKFIKSVQEEKQKAIASAIVELQKPEPDRKSTRLNSSHTDISYAVFCLKKKKQKKQHKKATKITAIPG